LTIKLTRHVAAATCFFAEFRADNSPFFFPQFALSSRTCGLKKLRIRSDKSRSKTLSIFASFFSCQRASALGTAQSVPRLAERSKTYRTENKKTRRRAPGQSACKQAQAASRDARLKIIRYS